MSVGCVLYDDDDDNIITNNSLLKRVVLVQQLPTAYVLIIRVESEIIFNHQCARSVHDDNVMIIM